MADNPLEKRATKDLAGDGEAIEEFPALLNDPLMHHLYR
jgi:hypothetical protein